MARTDRHRPFIQRSPREGWRLSEPVRSVPAMTLLEATSLPASTDVAWRPLGPALWVGRSATGHAGTIERGRRFVLTDADGVRRGAYPSLKAAVAAYGTWGAGDEVPEGLAWDPLALVATLTSCAGALLALYAAVGI
jgi:hypothetical protein